MRMEKMKEVVPVFRSCCFGVPLRNGLLAWGYFKLILDTFFVSLILDSLIETLMMIWAHREDVNYMRQYNSTLTDMIIGITIFFTDFIATIVFIVGGHKKHVQLIRVFYFESIGMLVVTLLYIDAEIFLTIVSYVVNRYQTPCLNIAIIAYSFYFGILASQIYFLLLLRSQIIKLRNNGDLRFVDKAAEAKCTMKLEGIMREKTVKENV